MMLIYCKFRSSKDLQDAQLAEKPKSSRRELGKDKMGGKIDTLQKGYCLYLLEAGEQKEVEDGNTRVLKGEEIQRL